MTVPATREHNFTDEQLIVPTPLSISYDADLAPAVRWWVGVSQQAFGLETATESEVTLVVRHPASAMPASGYRLAITDTAITVEANDLAGAFAAMQTLRQLAGPGAFRHARLPKAQLVLPIGTLEDAPGCAWRGVHLDVVRHFMPPRDVRRFIDLAAMHHLNVLHLHLTDDQGWRFATDRYPELTATGGYRRGTTRSYDDAETDRTPHGGFYTKDDLREIVAFAHERGVTVVPEIEVPGHVQAALAAYPWLGTSKQPRRVRVTWGISEDVLDPGPNQVAFFCDVLDEVCEVFDSPFIHIGGDEVPLTAWQGNIAIEARAAALGLLDEAGNPDVSRLHGWFLAQLVKHLRFHRRRAVVWDEACGADLPTDAVAMSWRGLRPAARALHLGYDVVLAPEQYLYLDHRASDRSDEPAAYGYVHTTQDVYAFDHSLLSQIPGGLDYELLEGGMDQLTAPRSARDKGVVLGMQAQLWCEYLDDARRVDYAAYPRLAAFSEAAWGAAPERRGPGTPASSEFMRRLADAHLPRLTAAGVEFRPLNGPLPWQMRPEVKTYGVADLGADIEAAGGLL